VGPGGGNHSREMAAGNRKQWIRRVIALAAALFIVGLCFAWFVGSALTASAQRAVILPTSFSGTDVTFPSNSGATLRGNFLKGEQGRGIVILMHGVRGNRGAVARHAQFLHGTKITSGYLESKDASAAVDFARKQMRGEKVAILGASLGGAAALLAEPPLQVNAMILELVYPDIDRAVKNRIALVLGNWARIFSPLLTWQIKPGIGVSSVWFSPERHIANVQCPKLIIGGASDRHTTLTDTQALFAAAGEPKELWIINNAAHEDLYGRLGTEYETRILSFLEKSLHP
jgi:uncharacterized protein